MILVLTSPLEHQNFGQATGKHTVSHANLQICIGLQERFESESKEEVILFEKESILKNSHLTNSTNGGEYFTFTDDVIKKMKERNKGENNPNYGKKLNNDGKNKLRLSKKNRQEVVINGVTYNSINQAAETLHIRFYNARKFVTK